MSIPIWLWPPIIWLVGMGVACVLWVVMDDAEQMRKSDERWRELRHRLREPL